jgi:hypothetical protein
MFISQVRDMNRDYEPLRVQSPVCFSSLTCFGSIAIIFLVAQPAVRLLKADWAILLVDSVIPILVTFIALYRSCWHRDIAGAARILSLILLSCAIFGGTLIAFLIVVVMLFIAYSTFFVGFSNFHY